MYLGRAAAPTSHRAAANFCPPANAMESRLAHVEAGPILRTSPARSARPSNPPKPAARWVPRPPRTRGTASPPATARQPRKPVRAAPIASSTPPLSHSGRQGETRLPSMEISKSAPQNATKDGSANRKVGPEPVISSPAAPSGLPARRFARRSAHASVAPPGVTPKRCHPSRPRSWTVVIMPGLSTWIRLMTNATLHIPPE